MATVGVKGLNQQRSNNSLTTNSN